MSFTNFPAAILAALHGFTAQAAAGGYRTAVMSLDDDFGSAKFLTSPPAGPGGHWHAQKCGYATAWVLAARPWKRASAAAH
ncbi:hypothetical protein F3087_41680 [Nocardia colli]|uniref:Uncharacterized protein n=1 Tax=Nocardia colli TaxID=2545717 RepID=A0A5N0DWJ4_9NOCA|nr:hypothetical protein [Nocardia colli]KAA8880385.1 hypothetical protein F3087_41680 [Nocardia colli]